MEAPICLSVIGVDGSLKSISLLDSISMAMVFTSPVLLSLS